jgi:hypothetical protein
VELKRSLNTLDVDNLSEEEKARQLRLLALRQRISADATPPAQSGSPERDPAVAGDAAASGSPAAALAGTASAGTAGGAAAGDTGLADSAAAAAGPGANGAAAGEPGDEGEEVNAFLKGLVDKKRARHHQLQIIQDFFENPVDFGVEIDYIPSGTPLSEIKTRKKELRYRIKLLHSVLDSFQGELAMLEQAERSALSPSAGDDEQPSGARTREDIRPGPRGGEPAGD